MVYIVWYMQLPKLNFVHVSLIATFLAAGLTFYYIRNTEAAVEKDRQKLTICLDNVEAGYSNLWDNTCYEDEQLPNCDLPDFKASMVDEYRKNSIDGCYRFYSR